MVNPEQPDFKIKPEAVPDIQDVESRMVVDPPKNEESINKVEADIIDVAESRPRLEAALKSIEAAFLQSKLAEDRSAEATATTKERIEPTMDALTPQEGEKLTPKNIENSFKIGKPIEVRVQRSSGEIEEGWIVVGSNDKDAVVTKTSEGGETLRKVIPLEELKELNKEYGKSKPLDQSEVSSREPQEGGSVSDNEKTPKILTDVEQFAKNLEAAEAKLAEAIKEKESIDAFILKEKVGLMERAKIAGSETLNAIRKVDEMWKKVPLKFKLPISGALILFGLGAFGAVAAMSTNTIVGVGLVSGAIRGLGMASLFVGFETMFKATHEKIKGEPLSKKCRYWSQNLSWHSCGSHWLTHAKNIERLLQS